MSGSVLHLLRHGAPETPGLLMGRTDGVPTPQGIAACVTVVIEPGRLRMPRDEIESRFVLDDQTLHKLFPPGLPRVLLVHTRPEIMLGTLRRLDDGRHKTRALGYINRGGTLDVQGMLFANRCTAAHAVTAARELVAAGEC